MPAGGGRAAALSRLSGRDAQDAGATEDLAGRRGWARIPGKDGRWIADSGPGPPLPSLVPLSPLSLSPQPGHWLLRWPLTPHCWLRKRPLEFP